MKYPITLAAPNENTQIQKRQVTPRSLHPKTRFTVPLNRPSLDTYSWKRRVRVEFCVEDENDESSISIFIFIFVDGTGRDTQKRSCEELVGFSRNIFYLFSLIQACECETFY
jgi:hypothetical protein